MTNSQGAKNGNSSNRTSQPEKPVQEQGVTEYRHALTPANIQLPAAPSQPTQSPQKKGGKK